MASFQELLQILITADGKAAVGQIEAVGAAAKKDLGAATDHADRLGSTFLKTGAIMVGGSAIMAAGLFHAAMAADESEQAQNKLQNTIARIPELAGANVKAFNDQANALHKVTVADDEEVTAAQAMLGTFHLTKQQILEVTPLVVDYARKFGIDLVEASKQVGKAIEGQRGALQRNGVILDENAYAADHFGAVLSALKDNAGGYAEKEGKTFSGQLAITKNLLHDVEEGVGVGVIGAFNKVLGPVKAVSSAFHDMDADTQKNIGTILAFGTAGTGAVGGLLVLAGAVLKVKTMLASLDETAPALAGVTRGALALGATAGILGAAAIGGMALADALGQSATGMQLNTRAIEGGTKAALDGFARKTMDAGLVQEAFNKSLDASVPAAQNYVDALGRQGYNVKDLQKKIDDKTESDKRANKATADYATQTDTTTDAIDKETAAIQRSTDALIAQTTEVESQFNKELKFVEAVRDTDKAMKDYADARKAADESGDTDALNTAIDKYNTLRDKVLAQADAAGEQAKAQFDANTQMQGAARTAGETEAAHKAYRDELINVRDTLAPDAPLRQYLDGLIGRLDAAAQPRFVPLTYEGIQEAQAAADALLNSMRTISGNTWPVHLYIDESGGGAF